MGIQVIKAGGGTAGLNLAGGVALSAALVSVVDAFANVTPLRLATALIQLVAPTTLTLPTWTETLGIKDGFYSQQTVAVASAGTGVFRMIRNSYTINNTAAQTGSITGYFLNATETALGGITHNLMDLQVGGVSKFKVNNVGGIICSATSTIPIALMSFINDSTNAVSIFSFASTTGRTVFGGDRFQLNGTTSSFPAIKRNGAAIDFRLADDSGYCAVNVGTLTTNGIANINTARMFNINDTNNFVTALNIAASTGNLSFFTSSLFAASGTINASARVQIDSTTQGFLMPRMTQAQILLIILPANGLQVYNTDLNQPCFYDGTGWRKISHTNM